MPDQNEISFPAVPAPDEQAQRQAVARHEQLTKPRGRLSRLPTRPAGQQFRSGTHRPQERDVEPGPEYP